MVRMIWGAPGSRYFETGVDRGVLYPQGGPGVPWPGLVSVQERPSGGGPRPYYYDGVKYANLAEASEFEAEVEVFSTPPEFDACVGVSQISNGLFVTEQRKTPFGFSYRTGIGTDLDHDIKHYKIHLVYGALAEVGGRSYQSISNEPNVQTQTWSMSTTPQRPVGFRPSAHFILDSRHLEPSMLRDLESILYGNDALEPRLPPISELRSILGRPELGSRWDGTANQSSSVLYRPRTGELVATNLATNPSFETTSGTVEVRRNLRPRPRTSAVAPVLRPDSSWAWGGRVPTLTQVADSSAPSGGGYVTRATNTVSQTPPVGVNSWYGSNEAVVGGKTYTLSVYVRASVALTMRAQALWLDARDASAGTMSGANVTLVPGMWTRLWVTGVAPGTAATVRTDVAFATAQPLPVGMTFDVDGLLVEQSPVLGPYFDGSISPDPDLAPSWTGTENASESVLTCISPAGTSQGAAKVYQSVEWKRSGSKSLKIASTHHVTGSAYADLASMAGLTDAVVKGKTYTAMVTARTADTRPQPPRLSAIWRSGANTPYVTEDATAPNTPGEHDLRIVFTVPSDATEFYLRIYDQNAIGSPPSWWDNLAIIEGEYDGPWFDGDNYENT